MSVRRAIGVCRARAWLFHPVGKILIQASGTEEQIISYEIEREEVVRARRSFPLFRDRRPEVYSAITAHQEELLE
jgi:predicted amidohydrolase